MTDMPPRYGYFKRLPKRSLDQARTQVTEALKQQGFGVLTEIDVRKTLKEKINQDFRSYLILGACNPNLAHRALQAELGIGLLLPCNVCLWEDGDGVTVAAARPDVMFEVVHNPGMEPIVREANERVHNAIATLA